MKNSLFLIALCAILFTFSIPNESFAKKDAKKQDCATSCKDASKCDPKAKEACMKDKSCGKKCATSNSTNTKHTCTADCKEGHKFKHGEEGHSCTADCKK